MKETYNENILNPNKYIVCKQIYQTQPNIPNILYANKNTKPKNIPLSNIFGFGFWNTGVPAKLMFCGEELKILLRHEIGSAVMPEN